MENYEEKLLIRLWQILEVDYKNTCVNDLRHPGMKCEIEEIFKDIASILGPEKLKKLLSNSIDCAESNCHKNINRVLQNNKA